MMNSPDWFAIITDLIYQGIPMKEVARHMDAKVSESMLRYYRSGGEPLYVRGEALVRFWCDRTGKTVDQLPRKPFARGHRMRVAPQQRRV
jgi:hypothetical protein